MPYLKYSLKRLRHVSEGWSPPIPSLFTLLGVWVLQALDSQLAWLASTEEAD